MSEVINELAADIRALDGNNDLGAAALAEALIEKGWGKPASKDPSVDYPHQSGEFNVLGPEIFTDLAGTVISWKGVNYYPRAESTIATPSLKTYNEGQLVEVLRGGDWIPGRVSSRDKVSNHVHVDTERGPVTIASTRYIKHG